MNEAVYWDEYEMKRDGRIPSILAIGDSWFWYPFPGGSLLSYLGPEVARRSHCIYAIGNNGAEAVDYVVGKYRKPVRRMIELYGDQASAVFISGGGNDFAGFNDLRPLLNSDNSSAGTAMDCFLPGDEWPSLGWLLARIQESLSILIERVFTGAPRAEIFLHTYDYAWPDGRGVFGQQAWMKPAFDRTKVPPGLQRACVIHVIDLFSEMLQRLVARGSGRVILVDSRGNLAHSDWANEMHPTGAGFRKIVRMSWRPQLQLHGLA